MNEQLIQAAGEGKRDEIRRLVGAGADKNCKDGVREKSKFCSFCIEFRFNLSSLHPVFVCYSYCIFYNYQNVTVCSYSMDILL